MFSSSRRLLVSLALAATASLAVTPATSAQFSGSLDAGSLGATGSPAASGSLGSSGSSGPVPDTGAVYADYAALGDSYAALGDQTKLVSTTNPCGNSTTNYPHQLDAHPRVGTMRDVSCGGAKAPDVVATQAGALTPDTDLITLSIGGNDAGFGNIVGCLTRQGPYAEMDPAWTCEFAIDGLIEQNISATFAVGGPVDQVYALIDERAPEAKVVATRYLPLMPATDPATGACPFVDSLHASDIAWARDVTDRINAAVDAAATRNGHVSVLPTDTADRSACASEDQRWTDFLGGAPTNAAAMHPTTAGQAAMAVAVAAVI